MSHRALALTALLLLQPAFGAEPQAPAAIGSAHAPYAHRADVRAFAAEIAASTDIGQRDVVRWLAGA